MNNPKNKESIIGSCQDFLGDLASKSPVPGGGSASALVGAIGISLGHMVGSLTTGKKKYQDVQEDIEDLMARAAALQKRFGELADKDAEAFAPLAKAYGLPATTEQEKAEKAKVMEKVLVGAAEAPLEIVRSCRDAIDICQEFAEKGSRLALSDAGVGAIFCKAAMEGAALNVYINTQSMQDRQRAAAMNQQTKAIVEEYGQRAQLIYDRVVKELTK